MAHHRRRPAHPAVVERLDAPVIVFLTVCVVRRRPLLANHQAADILRHAWGAAEAWAVGRYVVMPDHVHLFCRPVSDVSLLRWAQFWKAMTTRCWPNQRQRPLWQRDCWDTQLRSGDSYDAKWEYVRANPVRYGLVSDPNDWPFQGEMGRLEWH